MAKLVYGDVEFIRFRSLNDVYETIGLLTAERYSKLKIEQNQLSGAWGKEGRILVYSNPEKFLPAITVRFTAGNGRVLYRVNCNDFIIDLVRKHGFETRPVTHTGKTADVIPPSYTKGLSLVPPNYQEDFIRGFNK